MSTRGIATETTRTLVDTRLVSLPQQFFHAHSTILPEVSPRKLNSSPDLFPADFLLFLELEACLKGHLLESVEEMQEQMIEQLSQISLQSYIECWKKWKHH
jgi:hypothetical protein